MSPLLTLPSYVYLPPPYMPIRLATKFLIELLKTYCTVNEGEEPLKLTERAIVLAIADPRQLVFDDLLALPAVKALETKKIHQVCVDGGMCGWMSA